MRSARITLISLAVLASSLRLTVAAGTHADEYRITDVSGNVAIAAKGSKQLSPAVIDLTLEPGDQLVTGTGGRVEFASPNGTLVELKENTTMDVSSLSGKVTEFYVRLGRFLGKFGKRQAGESYRVRTPIAVAAIRGTELAVDVATDGETQAGVIEGEVAFDQEKSTQPSETVENQSEVSPKPEATESPSATPAPESVETPSEISNVTANQGVIFHSQKPPVRTMTIPPRVVPDVPRFVHLRERGPLVRAAWRDLDPPTKRKFRQEALRQRIKWTPPAAHHKNIEKPRERFRLRKRPSKPTK